MLFQNEKIAVNSVSNFNYRVSSHNTHLKKTDYRAAFILHGTATAIAAVTNQTALGKTDVKCDWLHVTCTEIRLATVAVTEAVPDDDRSKILANRSITVTRSE
uniref:Uncharacterized protein n=1 Tax=Romanomermis culicivorax TaxID=13658 RepID=A0A915JQT6_ROMCU